MKVLCEVCRAQGKVVRQSYYFYDDPRTTIDYYFKNGNYHQLNDADGKRKAIDAYWPVNDLNGKLRPNVKDKITCPACKGKCVVTVKEKEKYEPDYCI